MKRLLIFSCFALLFASFAGAAELTARLDGKKLLIEVDGKLFTAYCFDAGQKYPYFYPVNGPLTGETVTTETSEPYPHHHSLFFGCDRVNGGNYWQDKNETGQIFSRGPEIIQAKGDKVVFRDRGDWKRPGAEQPIEDERLVTVTVPAPDRRVIDFEITLKPLMDIKIEKTNHSLFSARMVPALSAKEGGTLVNANGDKAEAGTFGKAAAWCDYYGTRGGKTQAARRFGDQLHARGHEAHRVDELCVGGREDVVHVAPDDREGQLAEELGLRAVGDRLRRVDAHDGAAPE